MNQFEELRCKNCGSPINVANVSGGVMKCEYCHSTFTLPREETNSKTKAHLENGKRFLEAGLFNEAYDSYRNATECTPDEPEGYFGMALAFHQVQYLNDLVNNRLQPICHTLKSEKFIENKNFLKAIELATDEQRIAYRQMGEEIDAIRQEFHALAETNLDYDCFICVKVSNEETGRNTSDSYEAHKIYDYLKENGYKPFFSERDLKNRIGSQYEAHILYALHSSECMLIVCSDENYLQTKWVKNEFTRFIKLQEIEQKESDSLAVVFRNTPIEHLPNKKGKLQGIDLTDPRSYTNILQFVKTHTPEAAQNGKPRKKKF